MNMKKKVV